MYLQIYEKPYTFQYSNRTLDMDVKYGDNKRANISMTLKIFSVKQLEL